MCLKQILHIPARARTAKTHDAPALGPYTMSKRLSRSLALVALVVGASTLAFAADLKMIEDEPSSSMQPRADVFKETVPAVSDARDRGVDIDASDAAADTVVTVELDPTRVDGFDWSETLEDTGRVEDIVHADDQLARDVVKMFDDPWVMRPPRRAGPSLFYDEDDAFLLASFDVEPFRPFMMTRQPREIQPMHWNRLFGCACTDLLSLLSLAMTIALFVLLGMYCMFGVDDENECTCCKLCKRIGAMDGSVVYRAVPTDEANAKGKAPFASTAKPP